MLSCAIIDSKQALEQRLKRRTGMRMVCSLVSDAAYAIRTTGLDDDC